VLTYFLVIDGLCVFLLSLLTLLFILEFMFDGEPLAGEELEACEERGRMDPSDPCTKDEKAGVVTHPLDSLPLIVVNVLMALALQTGWKLYNHSSTNAEMRKVPM